MSKWSTLTYLLTHSLTYLLTHSLTYLLTHSLTHSLWTARSCSMRVSEWVNLWVAFVLQSPHLLLTTGSTCSGSYREHHHHFYCYSCYSFCTTSPWTLPTEADWFHHAWTTSPASSSPPARTWTSCGPYSCDAPPARAQLLQGSTYSLSSSLTPNSSRVISVNASHQSASAARRSYLT